MIKEYWQVSIGELHYLIKFRYHDGYSSLHIEIYSLPRELTENDEPEHFVLDTRNIFFGRIVSKGIIEPNHPNYEVPLKDYLQLARLIDFCVGRYLSLTGLEDEGVATISSEYMTTKGLKRVMEKTEYEKKEESKQKRSQYEY